ncbi:ABC transporter permease [soil metagenome]
MKLFTERRVEKTLAIVWMVLFMVFLLGPLLVVVGSSFGDGRRGMIDFPPRTFTFKWYLAIEPMYLHAVGASVLLALCSVVLAVIIGVPAALGLVRSGIARKNVVAAILRAPVQIPAVVVGVSFLQFYYVFGDLTGLYVSGSWVGMLVAHVFISTPYVISSVTAVLQRFNMQLEEAALILGASPWSTLRRVTLPVLAPGVFSGATYAFLVSFSDLPISLFLASEKVKTFPVVLFQSMDYDFDPSLLAVSTLIIVGSFATMLTFQKLMGMGSLLRSGK